jgi:hypothetical protein
MSEELREKLKMHIRRTGRYPFLVVRPHPETDGKWQVLDGHLALTRFGGHLPKGGYDVPHGQARRAPDAAQVYG